MNAWSNTQDGMEQRNDTHAISVHVTTDILVKDRIMSVL